MSPARGGPGRVFTFLVDVDIPAKVISERKFPLIRWYPGRPVYQADDDLCDAQGRWRDHRLNSRPACFTVSAHCGGRKNPFQDGVFKAGNRSHRRPMALKNACSCISSAETIIAVVLAEGVIRINRKKFARGK